MRTRAAFLGAALAAMFPSPATSQEMARPAITIDSAHREITLRFGPWTVPADSSMPMMMDGGPSPDDVISPVFPWPVDTWLRSYRVEVEDSGGRPLPRQLLHHYALMDLDRRGLVYPIMQRLLGGGQESGDVKLPATIAVPVPAGHRLAFIFMWHNESGRAIPNVSVLLRLGWTPKNQNPRPELVLPFGVDVHFNGGRGNTFEAPPGRSVRSTDFTLPVSGHLLALSGHLHDGGASLAIVDPASDRVVARVTAIRDAAGHVSGVSRVLPGVTGAGPHLVAGHPYRLVVEYRNPGADTLRDVMGVVGGLFAPDEPSHWPAVDRADPVWRFDTARLAGAEGSQIARGGN